MAGAGDRIHVPVLIAPSSSHRVSEVVLRRLRDWLPVVVIVVSAGCTSHNEAVNPTPVIAVAIAPQGGSIAQGGSAQVAVTVTGSGGFTGGASITVEGLPTGVTASVGSVQTADSVTTATITLTVAASASVGSAMLTVRARGTGVSDATAAYSLGVTSAVTPDFSIVVGPAGGLNVAQGYSAFGDITVTRSGGFAGAVSFTMTGAPSGLILSPAPVATSGDSAAFGLAASLSAAPGSYTLTFHATADGLAERTGTLSVVLGAAGTGNVALDFTGCAASGKPIWLATQDGTGPWTRDAGVGDVYRFNVNGATGQVAWVTTSGSNAYTVHQLIRLHDALVAGPQAICAAGGTKTVNGTLANLAAGASAKVSLGGVGVTRTVDGPFQIPAVADGLHDMVAYARSASAPGTSDRGVIRRAQNIATGGALATVDLTGAESFAPVSATMTVNGILAGDALAYSMEYFTGAGAGGCQLAVLYGDNPSSGSFTAFGMPPAQQVASDFHALAFSASEAGNGAARTTIQYFHAMAATSVTLPAALPTPTFTALGGPYRRLQAAFTMPADYAGTTQLQYSDPSGPSRFVIITADGGAFATQGGVLALQDFTGITGWDSSWGPAASRSNWSITGISPAPVTACQEGARFMFAQRFGSF